MLKLMKLTSLSVFLFVVIVGLNTALAAPLPQADVSLFPYSADGLTYGFVDETGQWVIEPQFDFADDFVEGLALIEQEGQYGYIDSSGSIVIDPQYDFAADFAFGLASVVVDGEFGYIDQAGQMVIEPQFSDARPFTIEGLAAVRPNETYGYIDQNGQFVVEPQFNSAFDFSEGLAAVVSDGAFGYIDESGQIVIEPQFDFASNFSEDLAAVFINGQVGYIDSSGQLVIEPAYDFGQNFSEGLAAVSVDGQVGYIDPSGQIVIEPQFDFAEAFSEGLAAARVDELIGFIDRTGQMVIPPRFDDAGPFSNGLARVERAHVWGYIDQTGTPAFLLPISALSPEETLTVPFLPGVPEETRNGICLIQSVIIPESHVWRCIVEADEPDEISIFDPCLIADDGQTVVCSVNPLIGDPGFQVNLVEPLPEITEISPSETEGEEKAWIVQLANGAVCHFAPGVATTIDGKRANYTCSDSSILLGDLQPGTVWQADQIALGDITRTDDGYQASQINPVEIAIIWQPVDPAATVAEIGLSAEQISIDPAGVAETVVAQIRPAVPYDPDVSAGLDGEPAHWRFAFNGDDLSDLGGVSPHQAQLLIYPVEAYQAIYEDAGVDTVSQRIADLQTLLQNQPETIDGEIPVLTDFGLAGQMVKAQVEYLDFDGGSGVRFITHYGVDEAPVTEHGTFYTFQGITDDGQYYVAYYHPVPTELLPADFETIGELIDDYDAFVDNFDTYLQDVIDQLNSAETSDFTPDLANIDKMIESLQIQP